jgi:predicted transposase YbfD/YdcC
MISHEMRFYITSLQGNAQRLAHAVRAHSGIENQLLWVLDVTFPRG